MTGSLLDTSFEPRDAQHGTFHAVEVEYPDRAGRPVGRRCELDVVRSVDVAPGMVYRLPEGAPHSTDILSAPMPKVRGSARIGPSVDACVQPDASGGAAFDRAGKAYPRERVHSRCLASIRRPTVRAATGSSGVLAGGTLGRGRPTHNLTSRRCPISLIRCPTSSVQSRKGAPVFALDSHDASTQTVARGPRTALRNPNLFFSTSAPAGDFAFTVAQVRYFGETVGTIFTPAAPHPR
jgi:hypothetical protein